MFNNMAYVLFSMGKKYFMQRITRRSHQNNKKVLSSNNKNNKYKKSRYVRY